MTRLRSAGRPFESSGHQVGVSLRPCRRRSRPCLVVTGELDTGGGELLSAMLEHVRNTERGPVEVDLSGVGYVDSHGLVAVLADRIPLHGASPVVTRLLILLGERLPGPCTALRAA